MTNHTNDSLSLVIKKKNINMNSNFWHGLIKVTALESVNDFIHPISSQKKLKHFDQH